MRGAAIVVQTHARLYIALKKKLRSRRRSSTGGGDRLSGAQRRQVMQLFMNNKRGMSAARRINRGWKGQGEPQPTAAVLFGLRWDLEEGDDEDEQRVESTVRIVVSSAKITDGTGTSPHPTLHDSRGRPWAEMYASSKRSRNHITFVQVKGAWNDMSQESLSYILQF